MLLNTIAFEIFAVKQAFFSIPTLLVYVLLTIHYKIFFATLRYVVMSVYSLGTRYWNIVKEKCLYDAKVNLNFVRSLKSMVKWKSQLIYVIRSFLHIHFFKRVGNSELQSIWNMSKLISIRNFEIRSVRLEMIHRLI